TAVSKTSLWRRLAPVAGLFVLSPIGAEYLSGYHGQRIGDLPGLLLTLLVLGPLYGAAAIILREVTRRAGRGRPTIVLLAAAFGLIQAGLIDQSLFNHGAFEAGPYWKSLPALVPGLDVDVSQLLVFVGGHVMCAFAAPIAVIEGCVPGLADRPWLGRFGLGVAAVLYLGAAGYFHVEFVRDTGFQATPEQLTLTVSTVLLVTVAALALPRPRAPRPGRVPAPGLVGLLCLLLGGVHIVARSPEPGTAAWPSIAVSALVAVLVVICLVSWGRRKDWGRLHVLAAAGSPLLLYALVAYLVPPVGHSDYAGKYASNTVFLVAVIVLLAWAWQRNRTPPAEPPDRSSTQPRPAPSRPRPPN
ncbi:hypothetical protein, partial [Nonomuraea ceibae]|uniref:hypothetical protein n=1 Tax=Nonomuraea ceibae TaxID=1935170 RepID=UPI001C5F5C59